MADYGRELNGAILYVWVVDIQLLNICINRYTGEILNFVRIGNPYDRTGGGIGCGDNNSCLSGGILAAV
jgi:hypothetical protein